MSTIFAELQNFKRTDSVVTKIVTDNVNNIAGADNIFNTFKFADTNKNVELAPKNTGIIDVVNDFDWIVNKTGYNYTNLPKVFLVERSLQESTIVSTYFYYISNIINTVTGTSSELNEATNRILTEIDKFTKSFAKQGTAIGDSTSNTNTGGVVTGENTAQAGFVQGILDFIKRSADTLRGSTMLDAPLLGEYLKSYLGIYLTKPTGFRYVFPHYEDSSFININNSWDTSTDTLIQGEGNFVLEGIAQINEFIRPGLYIEDPKRFNFEDGQHYETIKVKFPLLNTLNVSYKKNYEFLWLLAFQNRYYRESFSSVRPPKVYTVYIPGQKYMPYAYISKLNIEFVGTRRILEVETPAGTVNAPIPDAYIVDIEIKALLSDSANMMVTDGFHQKISTSTTSTR